MQRYYVDERVGCIAVRDRHFTDPDYNGLWADTDGVIEFWSGETGPMMVWNVYEKDRIAAHVLALRLNTGAEKPNRKNCCLRYLCAECEGPLNIDDPFEDPSMCPECVRVYYMGE